MPKSWSKSEASQWMASDSQVEMLELPRRIAASIVGLETSVTRILDIASGPGTFLRVFLDAFPTSSGIWHDASETMLAAAQEQLSPYTSRLSWVIGDIYDVSSSAIQPGLDVVLTSRATHHFDKEELGVFYSQVVELVRPGGWIINLDHAFLGSWDPIFREARRQLLPRKNSSAEDGGHRHLKPAPTLEDHMTALGNSGISNARTAWQAFYTFLIVAQKA